MSFEDTVVLDAGSSTFKAGVAGDFPLERPPVVVSSCVRDANNSVDRQAQSVHGGDIHNWDAFEAIVDRILYKRIGWTVGAEGNILMGEPLFQSRAEREKLTQLMFEHYNVSGLHLCDQAVLSLYAIGKTSGSVIDIGHNKTDVAAVDQGQLLTSGACQMKSGLHTSTMQLKDMLSRSGGPELDIQALQVLRDAVLRVPESAQEAERLLQHGGEVREETHTLPDGQQIRVGLEGVKLGEALANPGYLDRNDTSIAEYLVNVCSGISDPSMRKVSEGKLLVCGGGSDIQGLSLRVLKDFARLLPPSAPPPALLHSPEYVPATTLRYSVWMGGSVLAKALTSQNQFMTRFDYNEGGPTAIHRKYS